MKDISKFIDDTLAKASKEVLARVDEEQRKRNHEKHLRDEQTTHMCIAKALQNMLSRLPGAIERNQLEYTVLNCEDARNIQKDKLVESFSNEGYDKATRTLKDELYKKGISAELKVDESERSYYVDVRTEDVVKVLRSIKVADPAESTNEVTKKPGDDEFPNVDTR